MEKRSYHNTTGSGGEELSKYEDAAARQEDRVAAFFDVMGGEWTPSQIHRTLFRSKCPITSVRRAMTNLTDNGILEKTGKQKMGPHGRPEYYWRKRTEDPRQMRLGL